MRKSLIKTFLCLGIVFSMAFMQVCSSPVEAWSFKNFWNWISSVTNQDDSTELTLIEDETTVTNGDMLRASTYALEDTGSTVDENTTTLKYFPVTMYDYDENTINAATEKLDTAKENIKEGIYFSDGSPNSTFETTEDTSSFVAGQYYIQNIRASENNVGSWLVGSSNGITSTTNQNDATLWTLTVNDDNKFSLKCDDGYMQIGAGVSGDSLSETEVNLQLKSFSGNSNGVQICQGGYYLCQWGGSNVTVYGGYSVANYGGNGMYFYKVDGDDQELTTITAKSVVTSGYESWNRWDKASGSNDNGQKTYTGLVESNLDAYKNIAFTKPEGGIFNSDTSVKSIYTNVEMPFVYANGFYTFDASKNGVYFHEDETQSSDGTAANNTRLYFNEGNTQSNRGTYGDGSTTVWAPYNDSKSFKESEMNYHFGLQATIPFTMTANGRTVATNDKSDPIKFSFSGDDDVWVFIDGQLVVDLGGIHNRLDVAIDFAKNTVTYSESNSLDIATGSYNDDDFELVQTLFGGLISQDRETFASSDSHELTIFYLERGQGSSNCKIEFNLPMKDTVSVTKHATKSVSTDGTISPLTAKEQETVNKIDFGFTLTKDGNPVANTNYNLINETGQVIDTPSTDTNGHFTLKNGQTARFIGEIANSGNTYKVVEDDIESYGFKSATYSYIGKSANGFIVGDNSYENGSDIQATNGLESASITVKGSDESEDSLQFVCENYFDANLPNPSSRPADDKIVIDYGLPVEIDVLANDVYRGDSIEITDVTGAEYGTATIENGKIKYQLTKQLTGVEVLTYTAKVTGSGNSGSEVVTASESKTAKVYIIPATTMYYEEDFSDQVTFTAGIWSTVGTAESGCQESGVVGTVGDSPYGSDIAYIKDSGDSNGSSKYVSTSSGAAQFKYKFTGWGTSFFARTTNNTGYMRVVITDESGNTVYTSLRNTIYKVDETTLYNIPVFTYNADNYGTYTVTVTIAKGSALYGSDFWLDGIRVYSPLNESDSNVNVAKSAYATDAEANCSIVTLREKLLVDVTEVDENDELIWSVTDQQNGNFVLFTDSDGSMTSANDYQSFGPKEEVYLNNGQSISFSLSDWDANTNKIYLGIKAPKGTGTVYINGNTITLNNSVDCYYDISNYAAITTDSDGIKTATFVIKAGESSLVSVTNIKVTGNAEFQIVNGNVDIDVPGDEGDDEVNE